METYQNILVVVDPSTEDQKALKRAVEIASNTGAAITAFLAIFDFSYEMTTMLSGEEREMMRQTVIADKQQWIDELIADLGKTELTIKSKVVWHNRPFESIVNEVIENDFHLVVKGTHQHDKLKSVIFTPTDWHILRKCPSPVLLVKDHAWPTNGKVIAALNVGSDEAEHQQLNNKITTEALNFGKEFTADVHLINSFPGTPVNIAIEIPEFNSNEYNLTMLNHHKEAMEEHANKFNIALENTSVEEGLPEDVIKNASKRLDAELVVLGTIGRTGLSAAFIGNTAEHVIDRLNCDVLALKPDGYVSPLEG